MGDSVILLNILLLVAVLNILYSRKFTHPRKSMPVEFVHVYIDEDLGSEVAERQADTRMNGMKA
ncbi:MAG: hypothetical protein ABIJ19_02440 [Patescibacteria group bacterium]